MGNKKQILFTFDTHSIEDIYMDCDDQVTMSSRLIEEFFKNPKDTNKFFLCLLCENYSLHYKLKEQLGGWFENMPITKKDDREIITVSEQEAMILEATVYAREEIKADLRKKFNISNHYN